MTPALLLAIWFFGTVFAALAFFAIGELILRHRDNQRPAGEVVRLPARLRVVEAEPELPLVGARVIPLRRDWDRGPVA